MGGDPGGEIRKFFSIGGGRSRFSSAVGDDGENMGLGSERYTLKIVGILHGRKFEKHDHRVLLGQNHVPVWESQNKRITSVLREFGSLLCVIHEDDTRK
jgi:hypothetical protein